jgi:peptide/nickel transport system permease protein
VGTLLAGNAILTESVFNIPGVGRLLYQAISVADLTTIEGVTLFGSFFIVFFNLVVDIAYAYLDPRVRYS